jgi:hypothetical protein
LQGEILGMKNVFICLLIFFFGIVGPTPPARASTVFGDLASVVTDPLKFGKMSANFKDGVLQALAQINALADKADVSRKCVLNSSDQL